MPGLFQQWFTTKSKPHQPPGAPAHSTITGAAVAPGTSSDQFKTNEQAYYQQLLSGTGQMPTDGALPAGIQQNIDAQASQI